MALHADYFAQHGYLILRQHYPLDDLARLTPIVETIYRQWQLENQHHPGFFRLVNMHSLTHPSYFTHHPKQRLTFFKLLAHEKLVEIISQVFGQGLYFHNSQLFFNPQNQLQANYWHRDLQYSSIPDDVQQLIHHDLLSLHVRIPLQDETGIELIPGSHTLWDTALQHAVRFAEPGHQQHDALPHSRLISLKRGDVLIFSSQMIHRGRYDFDETRLALDICMGKPHSMLSGLMDKTIQPSEQELDAIQFAAWYREATKIT